MGCMCPKLVPSMATQDTSRIQSTSQDEVMGGFEVVALQSICANYFETHVAPLLAELRQGQEQLRAQVEEHAAVNLDSLRKQPDMIETGCYRGKYFHPYPYLWALKSMFLTDLRRI